MRRVSFWLIPIAVLQCSSPTAPPTLLFDTPYALRTVNGKPLPYSLCAPNDPCGTAYLALSLTFHRNLTVNYDQTSTTPVIQGPVVVHDTLFYDYLNTQVTIFYGSSEIGTLTYSDSATVLNHGLTLSAKRVGGRYQMNFEAP